MRRNSFTVPPRYRWPEWWDQSPGVLDRGTISTLPLDADPVKARLYVPDPGNETGWGSYFVYGQEPPITPRKVGF